jgi:hypothetical protein
LHKKGIPPNHKMTIVFEPINATATFMTLCTRLSLMLIDLILLGKNGESNNIIEVIIIKDPTTQNSSSNSDPNLLKI